MGTLADIVDHGVAEAKQYEEDLEGETNNPPNAFEFLTNYDQSVDEYLTEELLSRIFAGQYSERYRSTQLTDEGIVDVRLNADTGDLEPGELELLAECIAQNHRYEPHLIDEVEDGHSHLDSLINRGLVRRVEEDGSRYVMVEEDTIECAVVGEATPTYYSPGQEDFVTSLESTLADVPDDIVEFDSTRRTARRSRILTSL